MRRTENHSLDKEIWDVKAKKNNPAVSNLKKQGIQTSS